MKQKLALSKNVKICLQNTKSYLILPSRHCHFHLILILLVKMVKLPQQHANTTVHWLQTLTLPIVAKSSILNVEEFLDPFLKTSWCTKTSPVLCENQSFSYYLQMLPLFTVWWSIFDKPFRQLLPPSSFYGSIQWLLKVKITCEKVNFIEK